MGGKHDKANEQQDAAPAGDVPTDGDGTAATTPKADAQDGAASNAAATIERLEAELKSAKERLLEVLADRDNQAKRFARERQVVRDEITARAGREMIDVLDNLDLVLQSLPEAERAAPLAQGVLLTRSVFLDKLRGFGIEPIETAGQPFSPFQHEAVLQEERKDVVPGAIIGEISRGYRLGAQLVRAAKVRVAKAPAAAAEAK